MKSLPLRGSISVRWGVVSRLLLERLLVVPRTELLRPGTLVRSTVPRLPELRSLAGRVAIVLRVGRDSWVALEREGVLVARTGFPRLARA